MAKCCVPNNVKIPPNSKEIVGKYSVYGTCEPCKRNTYKNEVAHG